jgi:hypothetical protein
MRNITEKTRKRGRHREKEIRALALVAVKAVSDAMA